MKTTFCLYFEKPLIFLVCVYVGGVGGVGVCVGVWEVWEGGWGWGSGRVCVGGSGGVGGCRWGWGSGRVCVFLILYALQQEGMCRMCLVFV
jgi:hypothetical protein